MTPTQYLRLATYKTAGFIYSHLTAKGRAERAETHRNHASASIKIAEAQMDEIYAAQNLLPLVKDAVPATRVERILRESFEQAVLPAATPQELRLALILRDLTINLSTLTASGDRLEITPANDVVMALSKKALPADYFINFIENYEHNGDRTLRLSTDGAQIWNTICDRARAGEAVIPCIGVSNENGGAVLSYAPPPERPVSVIHLRR